MTPEQQVKCDKKARTGKKTSPRENKVFIYDLVAASGKCKEMPNVGPADNTHSFTSKAHENWKRRRIT